MSDALLIAIVGALALISSGVLVEAIRGRRTSVSTAEKMSEVATDVRTIRETIVTHGTRIAIVERLLDDHLRRHGNGG